MKRLQVAFFAISAVALLVGIGYRRLLFNKHSPRRIERESLHDALKEIADGDLAKRHASMAKDGQSPCLLCHLPHQDSNIRPAWGASEPWSQPPQAAYTAPPTSLCLSCHNGTLSPAMHPSGYGGSGHAIGIDYRSAWLADNMGYNDPDGNASIHLDNGKIGCVSCHQFHGQSGPNTRIGIIETACEACHRR